MVHSAPPDGIIRTIPASGHYMASGAKQTAGFHQLCPLQGIYSCLRVAATFQAWCYMHGETILMHASEAYVAWDPCLMSIFNDPLVLLQWDIV